MGAKRPLLRDRLAGIELKLDRAEQHLADIQERGMAWISKEESWEFSPQINEGERRYVVSIRLVKPMPPVLPLMVDEVVHHLRSSLDHLASYLVEWSGGQVGRAAWPLMRSRWQWEREVERRQNRWQIWRKERGGPLAGATPAVRAFVEGTQPYKGPGKASDDLLFELNRLWNAEKHRVLNPIHVYAVPEASWRSLFVPSPDIDPVSFKWVIGPRTQLKLRTKCTLAVFEFPRNLPLPKVEMKGQIPLKVVVGNGQGDHGDLQTELNIIRDIVSEAVEQFPPPPPP